MTYLHFKLNGLFEQGSLLQNVFLETVAVPEQQRDTPAGLHLLLLECAAFDLSLPAYTCRFQLSLLLQLGPANIRPPVLSWLP